MSDTTTAAPPPLLHFAREILRLVDAGLTPHIVPGSHREEQDFTAALATVRQHLAQDPRPMAKAVEMERYDAFLRSLPQDSYLRPWLSSIRDSVRADIANDIIPEVTLHETFHQCQAAHQAARKWAAQCHADAERRAAGIIEEAQKKAKAINDLAERQADTTRRELQGDIARLRHSLSAFA